MKLTSLILLTWSAGTIACNIDACRVRPLEECDLVLCPPILDLNSKQLTGTIPDRIGSLFVTNQLDLGNNSLTGKIPGSLGNLVLSKLDLSHNQLSGQIPEELATSTAICALEDLFLDGNKLTGAIPSDYCETAEGGFPTCNVGGPNDSNKLCIPADCQYSQIRGHWCGLNKNCTAPSPSPSPRPPAHCCNAKPDDPAYKPICEGQATKPACTKLSATCMWSCGQSGKCDAKDGDQPYQPFCAKMHNRTACLKVNKTCQWDV